MKMGKYSDIRSLDQLDRAISRNREALDLQKARLSRTYGEVRNFYTPRSFLSAGARRLGSAIPVGDLILLAIGRIRRRLKK
ncbi:MAG: hypothetical protein IJM35_02890 [Bacteroidales bacterium]|nr:hypothetical protein [Bacteroidales bacterium]